MHRDIISEPALPTAVEALGVDPGAVHSKRARYGPTPEDLSAIQDGDCELAVWQRVADVQTARAFRAADELPRLRFSTAVSMLNDTSQAATATLADEHLRQWLACDIARLGRVFAELMSCTHDRIRLEHTGVQSCPKFHRDNVAARMIRTYVGPGTEWGLARPGQEPVAIEQLGVFDVAVLKGERWQTAQSKPNHLGVVHRSPSVSPDTPRFVLVVDPAEPPAVTSGP